MIAAMRFSLAPMAGLTGSAFRRLVKWIGGCGTVYTELVSSEGLTRHSERSRVLLKFTEDERPIFCQIFGADARAMAESAKIVEALGADGIDLNLGCPVPKVVRQHAGAALLDDPPRCREIFTSVVKSTGLPVSVKMRAGVRGDQACLEIGRIAEESGLVRLTVHARTASQAYSGRADWEIVTRLKQCVGIPVFGNGDVVTPEQAVALMESTGADGIMIGRGAVANPAIFEEAVARIEGRIAAVPSREEVFWRYLELLREEEDAFGALNHLKQFAVYFTRGMERGSEFRREIHLARSIEEIAELAPEYLGCQADCVGAVRSER